VDAVIAKHEVVRQLADNHWLHLFLMSGGNGAVTHRYVREGTWQAL
jgi:hypothetical protein